jgi:hypothetical protein
MPHMLFAQEAHWQLTLRRHICMRFHVLAIDASINECHQFDRAVDSAKFAARSEPECLFDVPNFGQLDLELCRYGHRFPRHQ